MQKLTKQIWQNRKKAVKKCMKRYATEFELKCLAQASQDSMLQLTWKLKLTSISNSKLISYIILLLKLNYIYVVFA